MLAVALAAVMLAVALAAVMLAVALAAVMLAVALAAVMLRVKRRRLQASGAPGARELSSTQHSQREPWVYDITARTGWVMH
jgi:hypothetical protein